MDEDQLDAGALRGIPFFEGFSDEDAERLLRRSRAVTFPAGAPILERGDQGCNLYVVLDGTVRVEVGGRHHDLARGDLLGETGALSTKPRMATVIAAGELRALEIDCGGDVDALLREHPALAIRMLKILAARLREVQDRLDAWMGVLRA